MTTTPPEAHTPGDDHGPAADSGPRVTRDDVRQVSRIRRTVYPDRKVAGVAGGLARHLDVDPVLLRVAFVVLTFFGGAGLLLYGAFWLLLPEEGTDKAAVNLDERSLMVALIGVAVLAGLLLFGDSWGGLWFSWPLAVIGLIALVVVASRQGGSRSAPPPGPYAARPTPLSPTPLSPTLLRPTPPSPTPPSRMPRRPSRASLSRDQTAVDQTAADQPPYTYPGPIYAGPPPTGNPVAYRPRDPRKGGPILFWFTLALVTLGLGTLGMVDVAGADVSASAYPALAVGIIGVMLLVGAFFGRAGGLIMLGLVAAAALVGSTVAENVNDRRTTEAPLVAAAVADQYSHGAGELVVDLTTLADPEALDGRTIQLESGVGHLEVIVPENVDVTASASVGAGEAHLFDASRDGVGIELTSHQDAIDEVASFTVDVQLGVGEIVIRSK